VDIWTRLITARSQNKDIARSEQLFNALLLGGLLLMLPALAAVVIRAIRIPAGVTVAAAMGIAYLLLLFLYLLSRAGHWRLACQLTIVTLLAAGGYTIIIAGIEGSGTLYMLLAVALSTVLLGGRIGLGVMLIGAAIYFGLGLYIEQGFITPPLKPSVVVDGSTFAAIGLIMVIILRASTRELGRALARARRQARDLEKAAADERMMLSEMMTMTQEQSQLLGLVEELRLPVVRLYHGLVLLPVVGALDSHRIIRLNQELLQAVQDQRAKVAIVDITGVPHLESEVAAKLAQTAQAVRFMGCQLMLVGIRPRLARSLAKLELDKAGVMTFANLHSGLEHALRVVHRRIVEVETKEA